LAPTVLIVEEPIMQASRRRVLRTIHCSNGQAFRVKLSAKGGGLTAGKSEESGHGDFSPVGHIDDLLGGYAAAQAHAGAVNSVQAQVMTKGEVSLALTGKGHGWSLGVDLSELKIERQPDFRRS
jgi:hypothetical protein